METQACFLESLSIYLSLFFNLKEKVDYCHTGFFFIFIIIYVTIIIAFLVLLEKQQQ